MNFNTAMTSLLNSFKDKPKEGESFMFSFGDPEPVLNNNLLSSLGTYLTATEVYYMPPIDLAGIIKLMHANAYHGSILYFKRNMILKWFQETTVMDTQTMKRAALDYVVTGNCYFQKFYDGFGKVVRLGYLPAIAMRPGRDPEIFVKVHSPYYGGVDTFSSLGYTQYKPGEVLHLKEFHPDQGTFGIPTYSGGIQSVLLGENSTVFKRRLFVNGAHTGNVFVTHDAGLTPSVEKQLKEAIESGKGPGNFRSILLNVPRSSTRDPVKVIPVGHAESNDEFQAVQEITESAMLAMHRVPGDLAAILARNTGGFGDRIKVMQYYHEFEVEALQQDFLSLNKAVKGAVTFVKPDWTLST